ncbi:MAG: hypothetical protein RIC07_34065 [Coleofasciculus sp. E1-EBD-02]
MTRLGGLHQAELLENALPGEQFGGDTDNEAQHRQATIPGFRK